MCFNQLVTFVKNILENTLGIYTLSWQMKDNEAMKESWTRSRIIPEEALTFLAVSLKILNVEVRTYPANSYSAVLIDIVDHLENKEFYVSISYYG